MSRVSRFLLCLGAVLGLTACQHPEPSPQSRITHSLGAYTQIGVNDAETEAAALYAVKMQQRRYGEQLQFSNVIKAERQVVSGLNYRLCLNTRFEGRERHATAVVFHNLQKQYSLSIWEWEDCQ